MEKVMLFIGIASSLCLLLAIGCACHNLYQKRKPKIRPMAPPWRIDFAGGKIRTLQHDAIPVEAWGRATHRRLSHVLWSEERQGWYVVDKKTGKPLLAGNPHFAKRNDAIRAEQEYFMPILGEL